MRFLIRDSQSGSFLKGPNEWTTRVSEAYDFGEDENAIKAARQLKLGHVELYVTAQDGTLLFGAKLNID